MAEHARSRNAAALDQSSVPSLEEGQPDDSGTATFDHPAPEVPLVLDGELLDDPARINDLQRVLYYTPLRNGSDVALGAFTRREDMVSASREPPKVAAALSAADARAVCTSNPDSLGEFVCLYEHMHFGGDRICLGPRRGFPELTQGDWNDVISSVDWCRWDVSLFLHIHYSGDELYLAAGCDAPYLEALGWNDRASSAANWGTRF